MWKEEGKEEERKKKEKKEKGSAAAADPNGEGTIVIYAVARENGKSRSAVPRRDNAISSTEDARRLANARGGIANQMPMVGCAARDMDELQSKQGGRSKVIAMGFAD